MLKISSQIENQVCLLAIEGNLVLEGSQEIKKYVEDLLKDTSIKHLMMDFEKVGMIDSRGLGAVVSFHRTLKKREGHLVLCNFNQRCQEVFHITRLERVLVIYKTRPEALTFLKLPTDIPA